VQLYLQVSYSQHFSLHLAPGVQNTTLLSIIYVLNFMRTSKRTFKWSECLWCPSGILISALPCRVLLLSVAILSLYSVHLLLKISKEGG